MEKSEEKRELEQELRTVTDKAVAQQVELYMLGYRNGLSAAKAEAADAKIEKEPA